MIGVTVLGSTGSIGVSTLDVLSRHPERYRVVALTANRDYRTLLQQCRQFRPEFAVLADAQAADAFAVELAQTDLDTQLLSGAEALIEVAQLAQVDMVMAAIVGAAGLLPTLAAAQAGKRVLLANKEALVMSGALLMDAVRQHNALLLPIDSEHNAIFQCMPADFDKGLAQCGVERIMLTASGGPFRETPLEKLAQVTPEQACAHPNWDMGRKISVDSATMMNKGLEVVEACWLFNTDPDHVQVVIHPQSVVHSLVAYSDGSVLAQLGNPDMRTPIAHALAWPERIPSGVSALDLFQVAHLDFSAPDVQRFPCLRLAYEAMQAGGTAPTVLNAANEIAVAAFLEHHLSFTDIARIIEQSLEHMSVQTIESLQQVLEIDAATREFARSQLPKLRASMS